MGGVVEEGEEGREDDLGFADGDGVKEGSQGLRVGGDGRAASDEQRVALVSVLGPQWQSSLAQHGHQVEIIHLERDGEAQHSKVTDEAARLQRTERPCF